MRLQYIGEPERVYPAFRVEPVPGEVYDIPENPEDGRWRPAEEKISGADDHPGPVEVDPATDRAEGQE